MKMAGKAPLTNLNFVKQSEIGNKRFSKGTHQELVTLWDLIIVSPLLLINSKNFHRLAQNPSPRLKIIAKNAIASFISFASIIDITVIHCLPY